MKRCKSSAPLVQEKKIYENAGTKNTCDASKEPGKESRDDKGVELAFVVHQSSPDLSKEASDQGPKDSRTSTKLVRNGGEEEASCGESCRGS